MEPGAEFEQRGHPLVDDDLALVRREDLRHALQQRRLARPVVPDDPDRLADRNFDRHVAQRVELLEAVAAAGGDVLLERVGSFLVNLEGLTHRVTRRAISRAGSAIRAARLVSSIRSTSQLFRKPR